MSVQTALQFLQRVRSDETLRQAIAGNVEETLDSVVQLAATEGFVFTVDELRQAHKYDWSMRWIHYKPAEDRQRS